MATKGKSVKVVAGRDPAENKERKQRARIGLDQFYADWQTCIVNGKTMADLIKLTCDRFGCSEVAVRQAYASRIKKLRKAGRDNVADLLSFPNMQGRSSESVDDILGNFDIEALQKAKEGSVKL